jgi:nitrogen regulatory protein P-II 2
LPGPEGYPNGFRVSVRLACSGPGYFFFSISDLRFSIAAALLLKSEAARFKQSQLANPKSKITMKLIIAIVQPSKLESIKAALTEVEVFRLTVMDCQGFGRQKGQTEVYRGHEFTVNLLRKVQLQIAVNEEFVEPTIEAIVKGGRTGEKGEIGDGKIFVLPLDDCIRIRTGERGSDAI